LIPQEVLLRAENLRTVLRGAGGPVRAVDGVDLEIRRGETSAIYGMLPMALLFGPLLSVPWDSFS
jgi:predicted ABC-type transport system involved in lysophospholipase L1 biosynthesis ATPase subunit